MQRRKVMFVLPCMKGGGAERVAALLANEFHNEGIETSFLLTSTAPEDVIRIDLDEAIPLKLLSEIPTGETILKRVGRIPVRICSSIVCKTYERLKKSVPARWAYLSFWSQYRNEIIKLRSIMQSDPEVCVIAFLQPSIPITVLAARELPNKIIISERGNPQRILGKRYGWNFINRYYSRADVVIFQTYDAKKAYPEKIRAKGVVISNPVKADLPEQYWGKRNKNITSFCRISPDKDLDILIEAYSLVHKEYPEYRLRIIGDAVLDNEKKLLIKLKKQVQDLELTESVDFCPFSANVHEEVLFDAMYVNSSETEGMSNAMLEAMAIGMPVICTDCPIGGARATITDGENGLLVPVKDIKALYKAMKRIIEEPGLSEKLSVNAAKLRNNLSLNEIAVKWSALL